MPRYYLDQPFRLDLTVRDTSGTLATPDTIDLLFRYPDGSDVAGPTPTVDSLGRYHVEVSSLPDPGLYPFRWKTTGPGAGVAVGYVTIVDPFAFQVVTLSEMKAYLKIKPEDLAYDDQLADFIAAVPPVISRWVGQVEAKTVTETVYGPVLILGKTPVLELLSASWAGGSVDVSTMDLDAEAGLIRPGLSGLNFRTPVTVVYRAGAVFSPAVVNLAARIIVEHWWRSQRGNGSGTSIRQGDEFADRNSVPGMGFAIPRMAVQLLESVRVHTGLS